jgi:peptidoglycan/xylan/chitin deacetylase (PgdA/CDA1 family)/SAM-dependent methyltransferase
MNVSVIVPAYNAASTLPKTLQSLQEQTFKDWEAIIVNDGSQDETAEIVTKFAQIDARIRLIEQPNQGVSVARNTGIEKAQFEWLLFLDADDWILPKHLARLTQAANADTTIDAVYCGSARVSLDGTYFYEEAYSQPAQMFSALCANNVLAIHTCLVRRSVVQAAGCFDPSFKTCEDWDLWQRISRTGSRFSHIPESLAAYLIRPDSLCSNPMQLLKDGLRVIATGHRSDPRVAQPASAYQNGMPEHEAGMAQYKYLCWCVGIQLGQQGDPQPLLDVAQLRPFPGLAPSVLAESLFRGALLSNALKTHAWDDLWPDCQETVDRFLEALEQQSLAKALKRRVRLKLELLVLENSQLPQPLSIGSIHGITLEVTQPVLNVKTPASAERLLATILIEGHRLGTVELPIFEGFVAAYVLVDAIAAEFSWEILKYFLEGTIYPTLTLKPTATGTAVWRGSLCLAEGLPTEEPALAAVLHDYLGWTIFLQELWGRESWPVELFYNPYRLKVFIWEILAALRSLKTGRLVLPQVWKRGGRKLENQPVLVEVSQELPIVAGSAGVVATVGGVAIASVPVEKYGQTIHSQQLRTAILWECGFELVRSAVREAILGQPIEGKSLRQRLIEAAQKRETANFEIPKGMLSAPVWPAEVMFPRHLGATGTSVSRRALLPVSVQQELQAAAEVANEPVIIHSDAPVSMIYAPEVLWQVPVPSQRLVETPSEEPVVDPQASRRQEFETLFATQADPWKYTSPYEQTKYEQTLDLLPALKIDRALEIACAEGHFTVQLAPRLGTLVAADISQVAIDRAGERCAALNIDNVRFTQFDLVQDPIPSQFQLIVCSEVLYFMGGLEVLQKIAQKIAEALEPGGYFLTAHANLVVDEPEQPGYNWDFPFGAKKIGETFANTEGLQLVKELYTPLYRIQLFQKGEKNQPVVPEKIELPQLTPPPPAVADTVLWQGGTPTSWGEKTVVTDRLPILMYHRVAATGDPATARYRVSPQAFEEQLRYLRHSGFRSVTLEEWRTCMVMKKPLAGRAVMITFDDGYLDFYTEAWPLLKKYGFSAIVFLVTSAVGETNHWDQLYGETLPLLGWSEIRQLAQQGIEFGSHTHTHPLLTTLPPADIVREAAKSKAILQQELGKPVNIFAYPHGDSDRLVQHLVGACGYTFGLSCRPGLSRYEDSLLSLPRLEITGSDRLQEFVAKFNRF